MEKINCWEFMKCGRQPGGEKTKLSGICNVSTSEKNNTTNHGKNAGRCCWQVSKTNHISTPLQSPVLKLINCLDCDFFKKVKMEEEYNFNFLIENNHK